MNTMETIESDLTISVRAWLTRFAECVRARNIEGGRELFDPWVRSFGTRVRRADNLDDLVEQQWRPIWSNTSGFHFLDESVETLVSPDAMQVVVLAEWESKGHHAAGKPFQRCGRCTLVLQQDVTAVGLPGGWRAVHTHFSERPGMVH